MGSKREKAKRRDFLKGIPRRDGRFLRLGRWWYDLLNPFSKPVPVVAGGTAAAFTQTSFRFRNDDGSETTATWKASDNTNILVGDADKDVNIRLRIQVDETAGGSSANFVGQLRYSLNGAAYTDVTGTSTVIRASASSQFTDEAATTKQLANTPTGTFLTGAMDEANGAAGTTQVDFAAGQYTEFEWCFQVRSADIADGDTIDFRCYRSTNALNVYSQTGRITITASPSMPAGSVAITGQAPTLAHGLLVAAGSIALTGQLVGVAFQGPPTGSIDITGHAPTLTVGGDTVIGVPAGSISVTGQPPTLSFGLAVPVGSIEITGQAPVAGVGINIAVPAGSIALTGNAPLFSYGIGVPAGSIAITGQSPGVSGGGNISVPAGEITVTGQAPGLGLGLAVPVGSLTLTGQAPTSTIAGTGTNIAVPTGAIALTGQLVGVAFQGPPTGAITITGHAPSISITGPIISIPVPAGSITINGNFVAVRFKGPDTGTITIAGLVPQVFTGTHVPPGSITLTGHAPTVQIGGAIPVGNITIDGRAPTLTLTIRMPAGSISLTGQAPTVAAPTGMPAGVITITGLAPSLGIGISVPAAAIALDGTVPVVAYGIPVPSATLDLTGTSPTLGFGLPVPAGSITITGEAPTPIPTGPISVPEGSISIAGLAPTLSLAIRIPIGQIVLTGLAPVVSADLVISIPAGSISVTGYAPSLGSTIPVPAGSITITGHIPSTGFANEPPENQTALTARNLRPLGVIQTQRVDTLGTTFTVWYYLTAIAGEDVISVNAFGDLTTYRPIIAVFTGDPSAPVPYLNIIGQNRPIQFPVTEGQTYFVRVTSNPGNPSPANLSIVARSFEQQNAPTGSIFINDDAPGFPAAVLSAVTGNVIRFVMGMPAGEAGDILPSGISLLSDEFVDLNLKLFDPQFNLIANVPFTWAGTPQIRASRAGNRFYVGDSGTGGGNALARVVFPDGSFGPTTWTFPTAGLTALAANNAQSILYFSGQTSSLNSPIQRWDLINNVALSNLAPGVADHVTGDILVLGDDTIVALYFKNTNPRSLIVRRYSAAGAVLNTYVIDASNFTTTLPRLAYGLDDPVAFWVWYHSASPVGFSIIDEIRTSDGAVLSTRTSTEFEGGVYQPVETSNPVDLYGHSFSCPFFLLQTTLSDEVVGPTLPEVVAGDDIVTLPQLAGFDDSICIRIYRRLGDISHRIWSPGEIDNYLFQAVKEMCTYTRLVWDWVYPENLPRGFSFNHEWELEFINGTGAFDPDRGYLFNWLYGQRDGMGDGQANYTFADERRHYPTPPNGAETRADEDLREGWARHTFPDEVPFLDELAAAQQHATADLPHRLTELERSLWDKRTITATSHRFVHGGDTRYEIERGEVFSYTWRKDGVRTFRKIRVPASLASSYVIDGLWGIARDLTDVIPSGTAIEGTWGIPRIVPSHHPIGPFFTYRMFGTVRRFFQDRKNVRVEHWRIPFLSCLDSELPPRYRQYLVYYAMWRCLTRQGPGQDFKLGGWYKGRWDVALERIKRRIDRQGQQRTGRMGGPEEAPAPGGPPRPRLPWQYGKKLR